MQKKTERRSRARQSNKSDVSIAILGVVKQMQFSATDVVAKMVDISETGVGVVSYTPLVPGQKIKFTDNFRHALLPEAGVVMWVVESGEHYRAGVRFV